MTWDLQKGFRPPFPRWLVSLDLISERFLIHWQRLRGLLSPPHGVSPPAVHASTSQVLDVIHHNGTDPRSAQIQCAPARNWKPFKR